MQNILTFEVRSGIASHMLENPSVEVCGLITGDGNHFAYERCVNVSGTPKTHIKFSPSDSRRIFDKTDNVVAYVHTHPNGPMYPSVIDQEMNLEIGKPGVIAARDPHTGILEIFEFGEHMLDAPLMNRAFRHYVADCYEALRSWKWQEEGERLMPCPREDRWWTQGSKDTSGSIDYDELEKNGNYYEVNFKSQGYEAFIPDMSNPRAPLHPRVGDVILMQLDAPVINHAAVYIGNNQIYHHRMNKKSGTNALGYLMDNGYVRKWLRRVETADE